MPCVAVIPARRAESTIRDTLESLRLGNAPFVARVLVVTSNEDPTAEIVREWARNDAAVELVLSSSPRSAGAARNAGRAAASTDCAAKPLCEDPLPTSAFPDLVLFVDADCRLEAGGAARLAKELAVTGAAAVSARVVGSSGLVARVRHLLEFKEAASRRPAPSDWLPPSTTMLCVADAFDRVGGFPDLWPGEDLVFSQSLRSHGFNVKRSDRVVTVHRHPKGVLEMLRHQWRLGFTAAVARLLAPIKGSSLAHRPWAALLLLPARSARLIAWQVGEGGAAMAWTLALSPLWLVGLAAWTLGFVKAAAGRREQHLVLRKAVVS